MTRRPGSTLRLVLVAAAVAACAAVLLAPPETAADEKPIRIAIGTLAPDGTPWSDSLRVFQERTAKESRGRLKMVLFLGGRRGSEREMIEELKAGKLQGIAVVASSLAPEVPELDVLEMPFLFRDAAEADHVIDGALRPTLTARLRDAGLVLHAISENGWRSIGSRTRAVRTPADLAGLKVRAQESPANVAFWKALGTTPVEIPTTEVPAALEAGRLDAFDQSPLFMTAAGWHDRIKHFTLTQHSYQPGFVAYSQRFLDGLPADLREVPLLGGMEEGRTPSREKVRVATEEVLRDLSKRIEVIRPTPEEREAFRARCAPLYEERRRSPEGPFLERIEAALAAYRVKR